MFRCIRWSGCWAHYVLSFWAFFCLLFSGCSYGKNLYCAPQNNKYQMLKSPWLAGSWLLRQSDHFTGCFIWAQLTTVISGGNPITKPCWLAFVNSKCAVILSRRWYFTVEFFDPSWFFNCTFFYFWKGFTGRNLHRKFIFLAIFKGSFVNLLSQ